MVCGFWFTALGFGTNPLGFIDTIVRLTAVHFVFAGVALPVLTGLGGRILLRSDGNETAEGIFRGGAVVVASGPGVI